MRSLLLFALVFLSACQTKGPVLDGPGEQVVGRIELTSDQVEKVRDGVRMRLKDPASAMFGTIVAGRRADGRIMHCGYVNARNSFGGYTGMRMFTGLLPVIQGITLSASVIAFGETQTEDYVVRRMCSEAGLTP